IEKNEMLSEMLKKRGVKHEVLNAKYHEREAEIISLAGQPGAVTIATNMAGRGTDIVLGAGMKEVGGLAVFGTERHESRRIDNQLRGRSGRQGDPGLSRFYVSLEDDLMRIFGSDRLKDWMTRLGMQDGEVIQHPWVSKSIERAQKAVESHNFDIRKHLLEYDDVMNKQREVIYRERNRVLREKDIRAHMLQIIDDVSVGAVDTYAPEKTKVEEWDLTGLTTWFNGVTKTNLDWKEENLVHLDRDALYNALKEELMKAYEAKEKVLTPEVVRNLERAVILQVVDTQWKDHLLSMDHLKEGIGLQSYGGKDPLIEYKREGFAMFNDLLGRIKEDSFKLLLLVEKVDPDDELFASTMPSNIKEEHPDFDPRAAVVPAPAPAAAQPQAMMGQNAAPSFGAPMGGQPWEQGSQPQRPMQKVAPIRRDEPKVGRNDLCPCGSGKKYKKCHGAS
ncbi:MAG TPA: SEC-C metal-binding domain-containing protein, partial [bacterium]|nr:SEC-C metal-binding domain-containing protein [bacterium]